MNSSNKKVTKANTS